MLDYTNVTEVKDFILNILTENHELRQQMEDDAVKNDINYYANSTKLIRAANMVADILDEMRELKMCPQYHERLGNVVTMIDEVVQE